MILILQLFVRKLLHSFVGGSCLISFTFVRTYPSPTPASLSHVHTVISSRSHIFYASVLYFQSSTSPLPSPPSLTEHKINVTSVPSQSWSLTNTRLNAKFSSDTDDSPLTLPSSPNVSNESVILITTDFLLQRLYVYHSSLA